MHLFNLKATIFSVLMASLPFASHAKSMCASYNGITVSMLTFDEAIANIKPFSPKGEFETTAAYKARLAASELKRPLIISKDLEDPKYIKYNADRGVFEVASFLFDNTNFAAWDTLTST